jgi:hypothetical protein
MPLFRMASDPWMQILRRIEAEQEQHRLRTAQQQNAKHLQYLKRLENSLSSYNTQEGIYWIKGPYVQTGWNVEQPSLTILDIAGRYGLKIDLGPIKGTGYSHEPHEYRRTLELDFSFFGQGLLETGEWKKHEEKWEGKITFKDNSWASFHN